MSQVDKKTPNKQKNERKKNPKKQKLEKKIE